MDRLTLMILLAFMMLCWAAGWLLLLVIKEVIEDIARSRAIRKFFYRRRYRNGWRY